jgi:hypothetical protein
VTGETATSVYLDGRTTARDARGRITAQATGLPGGWSVRITLCDVSLAPLAPDAGRTRADPAIARAQRQMADPARGAALAAPLRAAFPGRPVTTDLLTTIAPEGLVFVREASVALPLDSEIENDGPTTIAIVQVGREFLAIANDRLDPEPPSPHRATRVPHLRLVQ